MAASQIVESTQNDRLMKKTASGISIVIPLYNSTEALPALIDRITSALQSTTESYELILVNDNGPDVCWKSVELLAEQYSWIRGICMMRNYGQHNASLCGIRAARYDKTVTMDDDLQHRPEDIPKLLSMLDDRTDVVYATPEQQHNGLLRGIASQVTRFALRGAVGKKMSKNVTAFRAFKTQLREAFSDYQTPFVSVDVLLSWATTRFAAVSVTFDRRYAGVSNYTLKKLVLHALDMMTGFSTIPLQVASIVGFVFTLFGIVVLFYVLFQYILNGGSVPGFPFLGSIIAIFSGAQLFALGIIGEYLARMHFRSMKKPAYTVSLTTDE